MIISAKEARKLAETSKQNWQDDNFKQLVNIDIPEAAKNSLLNIPIATYHYGEHHIDELLSSGYTITPIPDDRFNRSLLSWSNE